MFLIIFIPNGLIILYLIFLLLALRFTQVFYFILGCKLMLITRTWHYVIPWLLFLTLECSVNNVIKWTWSKYLHLHRSKTKILFRLIFSLYICVMYPRKKYLDVIFFAMHEKFVLIEFININSRKGYTSSFPIFT